MNILERVGEWGPDLGKLLKLIEEEATHWAARNHAGEHGARAILDLILHWDAPVKPLPTCSICGLGFAVEEGGEENDCACRSTASYCACHSLCWEAALEAAQHQDTEEDRVMVDRCPHRGMHE